MDKVPVGKSISHAYQFLFGRFFQVIGTAWLPAILYAGAVYLCFQTSVTWLAPLTKDSNLLTHGIVVTLGFFVVALVARAVIGISLTQEALGIRKDITLAHFVVGPREIRLIFAQLRLLAVVVVLSVIVHVAIRIGMDAAIKNAGLVKAPLILGKPALVVGAGVVAVLVELFFVLTVLKLSFLLTPVAAVEKHASIRRAWSLAGGSGWRILFVLIGTFLPVAIIGAAVMFFVVGRPPMPPAHPAGADAAAHMAAMVARLHTLLQYYADHALVLAIMGGIGALVGGALLAGATATAYRAVTGHEEEETEDDDALVAPLIAPGHGHDDGHGHGGHDDHGHGGGHDDHGPGGGHDDHGHGGGHDDHGHGGGHDDHGHGGGHDDHGHGGGHDDHGHGGGHDDHGHGGGGHDDHGHGGGGHDDHGHGGGHDDHGHGGGHDDHGHGGGHDDHGHGGGHDDHGHGHGDGHHHHARAA